MKILVVEPGAAFAISDVYRGLVGGLVANGHEVVQFRYTRKMNVIANGLKQAWIDHPDPKPTEPTMADAAYYTSEMVVTWALRHLPDWTIVVSGMYFHPDAFVLLKRAGMRTALMLTESPYDLESELAAAQLADFVWTNERTAVHALRSVNPTATYLPHAYDPALHRWAGPMDSSTPAHDVLFVGTGFQERIELLRTVAWDGIDLGLYGSWPLIDDDDPLKDYVRGGVTPNDQAAAMYRRAKVNLNLFRTSMGFGVNAPRIGGAQSLGPRAYELAACGAFFVSERRAEIVDVFGDLVPMFEGPAELQEVLRRWLPDDAGRLARSAELVDAVSGHSWHDRARQVVADLARATAGGGIGSGVTACAPRASTPGGAEMAIAGSGEASETGAVAIR